MLILPFTSLAREYQLVMKKAILGFAFLEYAAGIAKT